MNLSWPQTRCKAPGQAPQSSFISRSVPCGFRTLPLPCLDFFLSHPDVLHWQSLRNALMFIVDAPQPPTEDTYLRFDEYGSAGRPRRSAGKSQKGLNVETLVVADKKMVEKHGKANVTTYILTVMNMVREFVRTPMLWFSRTAKNHRISLYGLDSRYSHIILLEKNWVLRKLALYIYIYAYVQFCKIEACIVINMSDCYTEFWKFLDFVYFCLISIVPTGF